MANTRTVADERARDAVYDECCHCWLPPEGAPTASREARVVNSQGLHLRAAAAIVRRASAVPALVRLKAGGRTACGRSVLAILSLGLARGESFTIEARGERAAEAVAELAGLADSGFGEE
jgi:phosphotransferase system HPr (HPr) family protein